MRSWKHLEEDGILEDSLIDHMWQDIISKKQALLDLMDKFDLLCERVYQVCFTLLFFPSVLFKGNVLSTCIQEVFSNGNCVFLVMCAPPLYTYVYADDRASLKQ